MLRRLVLHVLRAMSELAVLYADAEFVVCLLACLWLCGVPCSSSC